MDRTGEPSPNTTNESAVTNCVTAFASAVKNLTIYPSDHPRVVARAEEFVAQHAALHTGNLEPTELAVQKHRLLFGSDEITTDHLAVQWLTDRCRDTGTSAIHMDKNCGAEDVVQFATALIGCPPGSGRRLSDVWTDDTARIRPVALVVGEHRRKGASVEGNKAPPPDTAKTIDPLGAGLAQKLQKITEKPDVQRLLSAIEAVDDTADGRRERIDVVAMIGDLLPADVPTEGPALQEAVETILARTLTEVREMANSNSRVRGADLLRSAVGIAKTYFGRGQQPQQEETEKPTGRPGDDRITADLESLLAEMAELPEPGDLRLPPANEFEEGCVATARELVGITLHGIAGVETAARSVQLEHAAKLVREHSTDCIPILDAHLRQSERSCDSARLSLLRDLVEAGLGDLIYNRAYVDDELLRSAFPEILPIVARVFRCDRDFERVREALEDIGTLIANGGIETAVDSGALNDPATVALLVRTGGDVAQGLLLRCEANDAETNATLLDYAKQLELPECERTVVNLRELIEVPPYYVRRLMAAAAKNSYERTVRRASGELLRDFLQQHASELPFVKLAPAVKALGELTDTESHLCLRRLTRIGWYRLSSDLRCVRKLARTVLASRMAKGRK